MTFLPDGEPRIPNQTPVPKIPDGRPTVEPSAAQQQPPPDATLVRGRVMLRTSMINGALLVVAVLLAYVFPVSDDPSVATFIVAGAAIVCALHLFVVLRYLKRVQDAEARNAPQPSQQTTPAQPYGAVPADAATGGFSFTVEDRFTITTRGTVVTGRVASGSIRSGSQVTVMRNGVVLAQLLVDGIEVMRSRSDVAEAGDNVGLLFRQEPDGGFTRGDQIVT